MQTDIRSKIIEAFSMAEGGFVSGQEMADYCGCSRAAVWKHIEGLRDEGYQLEAVRRKGYKLVSSPEKVTGDEIRLFLKTEKLGRTVHYEESAGSTQTIAHQLAGAGAPEGTIVVTEEQTAGKGRLSRVWHSPKYTGVWMSLILRPEIPIQESPQLTLLAAVAAAQAIEKLSGLPPEIKWPNDILLNWKKITGILTEMQAESDRIHSVIIGMGINVNQELKDFPEDLQQTAASFLTETGIRQHRAELIAEVLYHFEKLYNIWLKEGFRPVKLLWESYAVSLGRKITARQLHQTITGKALGITDSGVLLLEDEHGTVHSIYSADIEIP